MNVNYMVILYYIIHWLKIITRRKLDFDDEQWMIVRMEGVRLLNQFFNVL